MPQLDRIIVFTQIFWLFFVFLFLYIVLTHFFLPKFLQSFKTRNLIIEHNSNENSEINSSFLMSQTVLSDRLNEQLLIVKSTLLNIFVLLNNKNFIDLRLTDNLLFNSTFYITLYWDSIVLDKISLNSKICNFVYRN
uniref:ATP synthase F0 subunit 8 n=1 Tax=Batrachospermum sp. TaxID=31373 RepID=UPI001FA6B40D|nr:ATP synthase F0 subunit 8 [Batrachospermum sp.]UNB13396.1 ATP synthase F0 subunit 8 [Batrachospermum sp.]